jgi:DNA-binding response OmpR family regulator
MKSQKAVDGAIVLCAEEAVRDVIAYWLSSASPHVEIAKNGYEATRLLDRRPRALLVTDRVLPPWPGLATFMELSELHPQLRIAFVDDGNPDSESLARVTGADVILPRPLTRRDVVAAMPRVTARA